MMRVVMIGPFGMRPRMTMSVRALPLAKALVARGHQVILLLPPWSCPEDSGKRWTEDGVSVENIRLPPPVPLFWHMAITWRLVQRALALQPHVIHCFKPKAYAGLAAWLLWWLKKLGLVRARLVVDSDDWEGAGGWNDAASYSWLQRQLFAWQEKWGLRHHDALTVASRALESIVWSLGVPPERVCYIPNGVSESRIRGLAPATAEGPSPFLSVECPTVLLYTRFYEAALDRVVSTLGQIHRMRPDARFLIIGKGLSGEEERFLELCYGAGLEQALEYVGLVEAKLLPDYLARADVAIYPFDDTLINRTKCAVKLLDLMAAGVPIVADAVGQNAVAVAHGVSGLLTSPDDPSEMATAVVGLLDNPTWRRKLGQGAQQALRDHLTWEHLSTRVETAYLSSVQ